MSESKLNGLLYGGIAVTTNPMCTITVPVKEHKWNGSAQTKARHKRIQKKWLKRFGEKIVPSSIIIGSRIIAHPDVIKAMKRYK